jgi:hypothetical protein
MTTSRAASTLTAPVLLLGPWSRGRSYGVLKKSNARDLDSADEALLGDFALALTSWAKRSTGEFICAFPLRSGIAVCRARHMGEGELGPVAQAAVVVAPASLPLQRLIGQLPDPAAEGVGDSDIYLDLGRSPKTAPIVDPGLAWADQLIAVVDEPEAALQGLLDGVTPPEQAPRLNGWATTADLPATGQFNPAELFRLIVHPGTLPAARPRRATGVLKGGRLTIEETPPPDSWAAWSLLRSDPVARHATEAAPWQLDWAEAPAADVVAFAAIAACKRLDAPGRVKLLRALASLAVAAKGDLRVGLEGGFNETLAALVRAAEPDAVAGYIRGLSDGEARFTPAIEHGIAAAAATPAVLSRLTEPALLRLGAAGLLDVLAGDDWVADVKALRALGETAVISLLADAAAKARDSERARRLAALLTVAAADPAWKRPGLGAAVATLLALEPSPSDRLLAHPELMSAVLKRDPGLWPAVSARAVRPALTAAQGAAEFKRALAAALMAEAFGSAA